MIALNNIMLMRGTQILLEAVSLVVHDAQRVGIIGRNGSGKTSLFLALAKAVPLEHGEIKMPTGLRLSMMDQETPGSEKTSLEFVLDAHAAFRKLEVQLAQAERDGDDNQMVKLHSQLDDINGYDISNRAEQLLSGLGFSIAEFANPVSSFSGGWRVRLNLAAALMCPSDLLMLDEPTNHLDLEATVWLEQWLQRYPGTLLLISHDRTFLDSVIDNVIHFEGRKLIPYKGNYSAFEKQRAAKMALQQAMFEKQQKRKSQIEDFVRRFRYKASKAKQAQSRLKELERMQDIAPAHIDSPFRFEFPTLGQLPSFLMQTENLVIGFDSPLVTKINLGIRSESRIGLLGFNGSGKSTFLKVLSGQMQPLAGSIIEAKKLRVGYYAQHQVDALDQRSTPVKLLQALDPKSSEQQIRNFLGGFDFRGSRIDEIISNFSGGEKARLALAKVTWLKPNLLLLDEPTNHLDLDMVHALTVALQEYQGAMIVVSHDRHLLANTVDEFYSIHQGRFTEFKGDLHDYEKWLSQGAGSDSPARTNKVTSGKAKMDRKEQRQLAAAKRGELAPLRKREKQLERQIDKLQAQLHIIEQSLADESLYSEAQKDSLHEILQKQGQLKSRLAENEELWLSTQEEIHQFQD